MEMKDFNFKSRWLFFLLLLPCWVQGQLGALEFKIYGFEEGLSHRNVFKVQQDKEGYIWVATIYGLNRFDGIRFVSYSSNSETHRIPYDYVSDMHIGLDSLIWLAHPNALSLLNPSTNQIRLVETDPESALYNIEREPYGLCMTKDRTLYSATYDKGSGSSYLQKVKDQSALFDLRKLEGTFARRTLLPLDNGHLLISALENEIWEIDAKGKIVKSHFLDQRNSNDASVGWVTAMQETDDGSLWALLNNGELYERKKEAADFQLHPISKSIYKNSVTQSFYVDLESGIIWIGGIGVLWQYDIPTGQIKDLHEEVKTLTKNTCTFRQIYADATGVIWLASDFGLIKVVKSDQLFFHYLREGNEYCQNSFCSMRGICEDDVGNVYFSYYNSIHVLNTRNDELRPLFPQGDFENPTFGLLFHQDALWTGNGRRIDLRSGQVDALLPGAPIDKGHVTLDKNKQLWLGYKNQLFAYEAAEKKLEPFQDGSLAFDSLLDISYLHVGQKSNKLWIATNTHGLYRLDTETGEQENFRNNAESKIRLAHDRVIATYEDASGLLWLATANGLQQINFANNEQRTFRVGEGLPNNFINGLLSEGDTAIWVSTDNGLARLDTKSSTFLSFFKEDGLSANEFNRVSFYRSAKGRLFFGGLNGINAFYPGEQFLRQKEPQKNKILFTAFSHLDGRFDSIISETVGLAKNKKVELGHKDRFFTFEFALANYKNPNDNLYTYRLDGYDTEWSEPSPVHQARYNDIPPGEYVFRVKSSAGQGLWNTEELKIPVLIHEAYYKTWWFLLLCAFGVLALVYGVFRYRIYTLRMRERQLEEEVKLRTSELTREKKKSDDLLLNILPAETAEELKKYGKAQAKRYDSVTIFFSDFINFTQIASHLEPEELVAEIDHNFSGFDLIIDKYNLEKIKTIGDAYMCAGGIPVARASHAVDVIQAALEIQDFLNEIAKERQGKNLPFFSARIGIHTGPIVTGIVGTKKFAYDIWGESVNIAARLEQHGEAGKVNISESTYHLVKDVFDCTPRGAIHAKNTGEIDMYFVERRK